MLSRHWLRLLLSLLMLCGTSAISVLGQSESSTALEVAGDIPTPLHLSLAELQAMPRTSLTVKDDGVDVVYEGVWVHQILARTGLPQGTNLRGKALATGVLAEATDGYRVLFSIAELDPVFRDQQVLLADRVDGKALLPHQGPLRLVISGETRGARAVRMLRRLRVVSFANLPETLK